ncbi:PREDICTED: zinc finger CCHC domain-containing 10 [Prunus dulcis]|uniref:PREDICTED: zinc finger CCHC domain-containing 10 n=1 Tax=Prunus dulcis TaxID=3755 RepID=A0A5E4G4S1_PRUDU|nr:hypothetical protein L3X38_034570 [Prunus dulcis]VVA34781.1 PREDICTED: zinc finger CCHC domain-containing 10 [Prunus dulcis]
MIATSKEDGKWSDRKMEGDGGLRTLECLRGRLLAERQASRVAKEDAELMGKKLMELKNQLNEEIKLKDRAEKKLKFLKRKLESLKISSSSVESQQSSSSKNSEISCSQSTTTSSAGSNDPEAHEPKSKVTESETSENFDRSVADTTTSEQSHESLFTEENTTPQSTSASSSSSSTSISCPSPEGFCHNPTHKSEDSKNDENSYSNIKSSMAEIENYENGHLDYVDNTLALVPASMPATCHTSTELKPVSESVRQVLDDLRNIRENLQSSMEKRNIIRAGQLIKLKHANSNN